jgi:hypothetical protein
MRTARKMTGSGVCYRMLIQGSNAYAFCRYVIPTVRIIEGRQTGDL